MDNKQVRSLIFDLFMTALMGMFFFLSFTYNSKARFVPLIIATPTFAIALWRSVRGILAWRKSRTAAEEAVAKRDGAKPEKDLIAELKAQANDIAHLNETSAPGSGGPRWHREVMAALWILLLLAMVWLLGFIWTIPLYILLVLRVRSQEPWKLSVGISLGAWAFMYILFVYILKIEFATGFLIGLFI